MAFVIAIVVGVVVAAPILWLANSISRERALDLLAVQLAAIAAVYAGSSLAGNALGVFAAEFLGVAAFVAVALFGRWGSPGLLAAGYLGHVAWDLIHEIGVLPTFLPDWYAPFCLGYDGVFAGFIAAVFLRRGG